MNPAWLQRQKAINAYLTEEFNRQLKAGYDFIAAAGRLSRQLSENSDAFLASVDRQLQASRNAPSGGSAEGRSSADKFDEYIRGVTPSTTRTTGRRNNPLTSNTTGPTATAVIAIRTTPAMIRIKRKMAAGP